jgi:hypothetical protein
VKVIFREYKRFLELVLEADRLFPAPTFASIVDATHSSEFGRAVRELVSLYAAVAARVVVVESRALRPDDRRAIVTLAVGTQ